MAASVHTRSGGPWATPLADIYEGVAFPDRAEAG